MKRPVVHLRDLVDLPRPGSSGADLEAFVAECEGRGIDWPLDVVRQFLFDHGENEIFLEQYDHLDLVKVRWLLTELPTERLIEATYNDELGQRVEDSAADPHWRIAQYRKIYGDHVWTGTWREPPLLITGSLRQPVQWEHHLLEGHTRLGVLLGLVRLGDVPMDSTHMAYVGVWR